MVARIRYLQCDGVGEVGVLNEDGELNVSWSGGGGVGETVKNVLIRGRMDKKGWEIKILKMHTE